MTELINHLKALADPTRLSIVRLLVTQNYCVGAIAASLNLTDAAISQHLKILREAGFVTGSKRGYFMHYEINQQAFMELAEKLDALIKAPQKSGDDTQCSCGKTSKGVSSKKECTHGNCGCKKSR